MLEVARELREQGWTYAKIGQELGKGATTIRRWLNPDIEEKQRAYYQANREKLVEKQRVYNRARREERRAYQEAHREEKREYNREYNRAYQRQRKATDPNFKLACNLRNRLGKALKGNYKTGSAVRDLGCTIPELRVHLESQFESGMTLENHGEWHIDHIHPLARFDLTDRDQLLEAVHYTNLQPLWAEDNIRKGSKIA